MAIIFSLWQIPFQEQEPYTISQCSNLIVESFVVPVGESIRPIVLNRGDLVQIYFNCTSGDNRDIDFLLLDEVNYLKRKAEEDYSTHLSLPRATTYYQSYVIPHDSTWYFVWDNSFSTYTQKDVTAAITKNWTETAYRNTTIYHTVVPSAYTAYVEYLGLGLVVGGVAVIIFGIASEKTSTDVNVQQREPYYAFSPKPLRPHSKRTISVI
jgi:hypothetical protein